MLFEPAAVPRAASDSVEDTGDAARTWRLAHGATQGAVAACLALRSARGRQAVVARDVPASVRSGLVAAGLTAHWLAPELDPIAGVAHGVTPAALDAALDDAPGARAAIVVAPAFHGAVPDVAGLAAVAHCHGAALVVEQSRGPHFGRHPELPAHAIAAGADLVVAGDLLRQGPQAERWLPAAAIDRAVLLCEPAAAAQEPPAGPGERALGALVRSVAAARAQLTGAPGVRVLGPELAGAPGVHSFDPLRLTADLHDSGRDARTVAAVLRERAAIALELVTDRLLVPAPADAGRFAAALVETLWTVAPASRPVISLPPARPGPSICTPRAAWLAPQERLPPDAAIGRVAAETLTPYPPGVPAVLPGERLDVEVVSTLCAIVAEGGVVQGSPDGLGTFAVVAGSHGGASRRPASPRRAAAPRWN
jgi:arginine/lysine/ornithine decarboxylase